MLGWPNGDAASPWWLWLISQATATHAWLWSLSSCQTPGPCQPITFTRHVGKERKTVSKASIAAVERSHVWPQGCCGSQKPRCFEEGRRLAGTLLGTAAFNQRGLGHPRSSAALNPNHPVTPPVNSPAQCPLTGGLSVTREELGVLPHQ